VNSWLTEKPCTKPLCRYLGFAGLVPWCRHPKVDKVIAKDFEACKLHNNWGDATVKGPKPLQKG
jgi:hypothetical protein